LALQGIRVMDSIRWPARRGTVYLVGAGPGDPGLLTLKARDLLASSDAVLHDQLVSKEVLAMVPRNVKRVAVGKIGHGRHTAQSEIHRMLVALARAGRRVVRLKGGCPTVFGRVGEEIEALAAAGVPFEIVPGVSSALAAPAAAGIPVTLRGRATSVAIVTGHCARPGRSPLEGVSGADTLVVLMGTRALATLMSELRAAGRDPDTPAAFVSRATLPTERTVVATLGTLPAAVAEAGVGAPGVVVVGEVVRFREELGRVAAGAA
jgi:uroporphyrin-III C-methyltransferase